MVRVPHPTGTVLLRIPVAADRLGLAPRTVWALIAAGRLEVVRLGPRATRIPEEAVEAFIDAARTHGRNRDR